MIIVLVNYDEVTWYVEKKGQVSKNADRKTLTELMEEYVENGDYTVIASAGDHIVLQSME